MAELLVAAFNQNHPNQAEDRRGCFKVGDVIDIKPDGHPWGRKECLSKFWVFHIEGSVEEHQYLFSHELGENDEILTARKMYVDFESRYTHEQLAAVTLSDWLVLSVGPEEIKEKINGYR